MNKVKKGFTLVEIMIVVAIIAILAAVAIPNFMTYRKTSQQNACKANMKQILAACEAYTIKHSAVPASVANLTDTSKGGFLKSEPKCPLGTGTYTLAGTTDSITTITCPNTAPEGFAHTME